MRSALRDLTPILLATACHQRNYVERYSRSNYCFLQRASTALPAADPWASSWLLGRIYRCFNDQILGEDSRYGKMMRKKWVEPAIRPCGREWAIRPHRKGSCLQNLLAGRFLWSYPRPIAHSTSRRQKGILMPLTTLIGSGRSFPPVGPFSILHWQHAADMPHKWTVTAQKWRKCAASLRRRKWHASYRRPAGCSPGLF